MNSALARTETADLLEELSPFIPDDFFNELIGPQHGPGRRRAYRPAQLYRLLLLALLTPAHSFNLVVELLREQRAWRQFVHLPNRRTVPDATLLHDFRAALARKFHSWIEQRSGGSVRRLDITQPNENATHRFFEDRL